MKKQKFEEALNELQSEIKGHRIDENLIIEFEQKLTIICEKFNVTGKFTMTDGGLESPCVASFKNGKKDGFWEHRINNNSKSITKYKDDIIVSKFVEMEINDLKTIIY